MRKRGWKVKRKKRKRRMEMRSYGLRKKGWKMKMRRKIGM